MARGIDQQRLMDLLKEAAKPETEDCCKLQGELMEALTVKLERQYEPFELLIASLVQDTFDHDRTLLPSLFPAFVVILGDYNGEIPRITYAGSVDWAIAAQAQL